MKTVIYFQYIVLVVYFV